MKEMPTMGHSLEAAPSTEVLSLLMLWPFCRITQCAVKLNMLYNEPNDLLTLYY